MKLRRKTKKKIPAGRRQKAARLFQQGLAAHQRGDAARARRAYREALRLYPSHAPSLNNLGLLAHQGGDRREAISFYRRAVAADPGHTEGWINLASVLAETGDLAEAERIASRFDLAADDPRPLNLAASIAHRCGDRQRAEALYRRSLSLAPDFAPTLIGLATVLADSTAGETLEQDTPGRQEAKEILERLLAQDPNFAPALVEYGRLLHRSGEYGAALPILERAAAVTSEGAALLAFLYLDIGEPEKGLQGLKSLASAGDEVLASSYVGALNYAPNARPEDLLQAARQWCVRHAKPHRKRLCRPHASPRSPLRVGLVSPDFRDHPVGYFVHPLLAHHDRAQIELHCYRIGGVFDRFAGVLKELADGWRDLTDLSDDEAAQAIAADDLDVLLDLAGHTRGNRLAIFARRPAPLQGAWLGYQATTGMEEIDFRLTDRIADPSPERDGQGYSERLVHLPGPFFCFTPPPQAPPVAPPPLRRQGVLTFGSINNFRKLHRQVLSCWAELLHRLPESRLLICCPQARDQWLRERVRRFFADQGVAAARILFQAPLPFDEYLAFISREIDILLDPFPLCGHTVSCQALWMGVPLVTLRGDRFGGRMGASIVAHLGLEWLAAADRENYIATAAALAGQPEQLADLRAGMRQRLLASPLTNGPEFAAGFAATLARLAAGRAVAP